jgi:hypothetical protein
VTVLPSHADDGAVESCWQRCYRGDLVAVQYRCRVMQATIQLSQAGEAPAEMTSLRRDVDAESCWWQCCRVMLVTALLWQIGRDMI